LSDKLSLKDTSTTNTLFTLLNGLSFGAGPVIGGYLSRVSPFAIRPCLGYLTFAGQLALVFHHQRAYRCPQPRYSLLPSP
jgi:hypothetical protein